MHKRGRAGGGGMVRAVYSALRGATRKRSASDKSADGPQVRAVQMEYCIAMLRPTCGAGNSEALSSGAARP